MVQQPAGRASNELWEGSLRPEQLPPKAGEAKARELQVAFWSTCFPIGVIRFRSHSGMLWIRHLTPEQLPPREGAAKKRKLRPMSSAQRGSLRHAGVSSRAAVPVSMCTAAALGLRGNPRWVSCMRVAADNY